MDKLLEECCASTGYEKAVVDNVVKCFLEKIVDELSQGNRVDLGEDFGTFSVKLRTGKPQENSPRTPKDSHYRTIFRENRGMRKRLKTQMILDE